MSYFNGYTAPPNPTSEEQRLVDLAARVDAFRYMHLAPYDSVGRLQLAVLKDEARALFGQVTAARQAECEAAREAIVATIKQRIEEKGRGWDLVSKQLHTPIEVVERTLLGSSGPRLTYVIRICSLLGLEVTLREATHVQPEH